MGDTNIIWGLLIFFILTGLITGWINQEIDNVSVTNDAEGIGEQVENKSGLVTMGLMLLEILKMATWSFGSLPLVIELLLFMPLRILFYFVIGKQILGSGA